MQEGPGTLHSTSNAGLKLILKFFDMSPIRIDHGLLLQEVVAQLLAQSEGQHVVREGAGGTNTCEPAPPAPRGREPDPCLLDPNMQPGTARKKY